MGTACVAAAATLGGGDEVARTAREAEEDYRTRPRQRRGEGDPPRNAARPAGGEEDREVDSPCFVPGPGGGVGGGQRPPAAGEPSRFESYRGCCQSVLWQAGEIGPANPAGLGVD
jgi:hypothetical protein